MSATPAATPAAESAEDRGAQLERLRSAALARVARLDEAIVALRADRSVDNADDEHDPEGVTLSSEWARLEGLRTAAAREADDIASAIARRSEGADGVCEDCGRGIPPERLEVRPTATRCVDCAARAGV